MRPVFRDFRRHTAPGFDTAGHSGWRRSWPACSADGTGQPATNTCTSCVPDTAGTLDTACARAGRSTCGAIACYGAGDGRAAMGGSVWR